jgi:MerR family mercuric resistance operon transcriptional regulator
MHREPTMTIGRLAAHANVNVETVRYYQRLGLLRAPARHLGAVRRYTSEDAQRLAWIRRAQAMGFSLREIGKLLGLQAGSACVATRAVIVERLRAVEEQLAEAAAFRAELMRWLAACDANPRSDCCPTLAGIDRAAFTSP